MVTPPGVVADGAGGAAAAAVAVEVVGASPGLVCGCVASLLLSAIFMIGCGIARIYWGERRICDDKTEHPRPPPPPRRLSQCCRLSLRSCKVTDTSRAREHHFFA